MMMTIRQRTALEFACDRARDAAQPRFKAFYGRWSTIITVNK
jgi:hypothetical protein